MNAIPNFVDETKPMSFGTLIRQRRLALNLSQKAVAERSGVPLASYKVYENDRQEIPLKRARLIADALGLSRDAVWDEVAPPEVSEASEAKPFPSDLNALTGADLVRLRDHLNRIAPAAPSPVDPLAVDPLEVVSNIAEDRGRRSKRMPEAIEAAKKHLDRLDLDELEDMAEERGVFIVPDDLAKLDGPGLEAHTIARIIAAAIFQGLDVAALPLESLETLRERYEAVSEDADDLPMVEGRGFLESEAAYLKGLRTELPAALVALHTLRKTVEVEDLVSEEG